MRGKSSFTIILLLSTAVSGYVITEEGVSCLDNGLFELDDKVECESALPAIQDAIPDANFLGDMDSTFRPPGCYYTSGVFWNPNSHGGPCSSCRSVCKG